MRLCVRRERESNEHEQRVRVIIVEHVGTMPIYRDGTKGHSNSATYPALRHTLQIGTHGAQRHADHS